MTDTLHLEALRLQLPEYLTRLGVELRPQGGRLVGRCPNHDDRKPSFAVYGKDRVHCGCYPCDFTGDVFAVSRWLGRSSTFPESVADVAGVLGEPLTSHFQRKERPLARKVEPPFALSDSERSTIEAARLAFTDAFHSGEPIVDEIAESLGVGREALRWASWGQSGLGLANGWLTYRYPNGLKLRNRDPKATPRFRWLVGKATAPWRAEWIRPETKTVYLTEGESDCLALVAAGVESDGTAVCVASPGTSFPAAWAALFAGKRVVLCFDRDHAGRTATARVAAILKNHATEILTWKA
jgi:hypothetical protein